MFWLSQTCLMIFHLPVKNSQIITNQINGGRTEEWIHLGSLGPLGPLTCELRVVASVDWDWNSIWIGIKGVWRRGGPTVSVYLWFATKGHQLVANWH